MSAYEMDLINIHGSLSRVLELNQSTNKSMHWLVMAQLALCNKIVVIQPREFF